MTIIAIIENQSVIHLQNRYKSDNEAITIAAWDVESMGPAYSTFGQWVKSRRKERHVTQKELGKLVGYAEITVRQIESDTYKLTRFLVERFVSSLALPLDDHDTIIRFALKQSSSSPARPRVGAHYRSGTPFVGRQEELAQLADWLRNPECRCISVVGVGGVGKTRIAAQVLSMNAYEADHEAWFVPLTDVTSVDVMVQTIADVVDIRLNPITPPLEQLILALQTRRGLLVLDNFEQLLPEGSNLLVALLGHAPDIRLVVTSRERLRISGEWILRLEGLDIAKDDAQSSAVDLFISTAQRMNHRFSATDTAAIREICRILMGIPLAIEMAASWVELLSYAEILSTVSKKALDLASRYRDMDERHQSLQAVFETTWERLAPRAQSTLLRLAIFQSGFSRAAALEVAEADAELLAYLQDRMLIQTQGSNRLVLHEMIRQFALKKFADQPEEFATAQRRHAEYYVQYVGISTPRLKYEHTRAEVTSISVELENIRAAWKTMLHEHRGDWFLECWEGVFIFYNVISRFHEGEALFRTAVHSFEVDSESFSERRASGLSRLFCCLLMFRQGRIPEAAAVLFSSETRHIRSSTEPLDQYWTNTADSFVLHAMGNGPGALLSIQKAEKASSLRGNLPYEEAGIWMQYGRIQHLLGNRTDAFNSLSESVRICREARIIWGIGLSLTELGFVAEAEGRTEEASRYYEAVLETATDLEDLWNYQRTQVCIARVRLALAQTSEAVNLLFITLQELMNSPQIGFEIDCFVEIALVLAQLGHRSLAQVLLEYCAVHPECFQPTRSRAADYLKTLKTEVPAADIADVRNLFPGSKREVSLLLLERLTQIKKDLSLS